MGRPFFPGLPRLGHSPGLVEAVPVTAGDPPAPTPPGAALEAGGDSGPPAQPDAAAGKLRKKPKRPRLAEDGGAAPATATPLPPKRTKRGKGPRPPPTP